MFLKLINGMTFKFVAQGDDVKVLSDSFHSSTKERWFSVHNHINESFNQACKRKADQYSKDHNSAILFFN